MNKQRIKLPAILAAVLALLWLGAELLIFHRAAPAAPVTDGNSFCTSHRGENGYNVDGDTVISFGPGCGAVEAISFTATGQTGEELTVTVTDAADPNRVYREEFFGVGNQSPVSNRIRVEIDPSAQGFCLSFQGAQEPYQVDGFVLNQPIPFNFLRLGLVWLVLATLIPVWYFLPVAFDPSRRSHGFSALALCLVCLLIAGILCAALCPNIRQTTQYPFQNPVNYYQPYLQQFDAMMKGQLHLDYPPSAELLALDNPYDYSARQGIYFLRDRALYGGQYYSYFGIGPILAVYAPYYFLTGSLPAYDTVSIIFSVLTALFMSMAIIKFAAMYTKKLPLPILWITTLCAVFASQIFLIMRGNVRFYYIASMSGMAFLAAFLWLFLCGISGSMRIAPGSQRQWKKSVFYLLAGICYGLCFLSRYNMALVAAFFILPALWFTILTERKNGKSRLRRFKSILPELICLGLPVILAVGGQLILNYLRFDSLFEFGTTYQLTVSDISQNRLRLGDLPHAIYHYFRQPLKKTAAFPFVTLGYQPLDSYGHFVYSDTNMGLLVIPMLWVLFATPVIWLKKQPGWGGKLTLSAALVGMAAVAFFNFCLGGVVFRYVCDLTLTGSFASAAVILTLCDRNKNSRLRFLGDWAVIGLMLFSILICLLLCFTVSPNLSPYCPQLFITLKQLFTW